MSVNSKMTAIADAIRAKTGKTEKLTLDAMPTEIAGITTEVADLLLPADYPDYVRDEVLEIVNKVRNVRKSDSIIFVAMSDTHYPGDQAVTYYGDQTRAGVVQANQAAKVLAYMLDLDFIAHMGDVSWGGGDTTPEMLASQIEGFVSYFNEAGQSLPMFICIGNHDAGIYYHDEQTDGAVHTLAGSYLYNNFTAYSASDDTVIAGQEYGGYCYRDFADKKLRVIMLNTSEKLVAVQSDCGNYGAQRVWLANALLNLNSKADATEWGFIILCHYPADYGDTLPLSAVLKAYVNGTSVTITDAAEGYYQGDGTNQTVSFANKNSARFLAQFHGHVHNFKTDKLSVYENNSKVTYDAWRICIPNAQFNRENYYTTVGNITEIDFSEATSYPKTANTENGTSFVVNVINPSEEKIYSFAYGAGYDRVVGIAKTVYYSIAANLTNMTLSNSAVSVEEGQSYTATLAYDEAGYYFDEDSVTVTMGGSDITSSVYAGGVITIPSVTGNVVITARAVQRGGYTNQIPLATSTFNGTEIYNAPYGFKQGTRLNSSNSLSSVSGMCTTGFIPVKVGDVVRFKNITISGSASPYILLYGNNGGYLGVIQSSELGSPDADGVYTWTITGYTDFENTQAMRVSIGVIDETSIITVNEEII